MQSYLVTLQKSGRSKTLIIEDVTSPDQAKDQAMKQMAITESGFTVSSIKRIN